MSTRSHIIVKDEETTHYVYHHSDGYLDGVGAEIKDFASNFAKSEYYKNSDIFCRELENWDDSYEYEDCGLHGDEEYLYTVKIKEGTIEVSAQELHCTNIDTGWKEDWVAVPEFTQTFTADIPPISSDKEVISDMMDDFVIVGWPDIQELMAYDDFRENSALIDQNENIGIGSSTYLVSKEWIESLNDEQ